jgi:raffinose synthase
MIEPALAWDPSSLSGVGRGELETLPTIFRLMHSYLMDAGVDGVKVDAQSGLGALGSGLGGGSIFTRAAVQAVETSVKSTFGKRTNVQIGRIKDARILDRVLPLWFQEKLSIQNYQITEAPNAKDSVPLIACMCHSTENLFSYMETPSARASDDFYPKDIASQTVHIVSCAYNSVFLSEIASPDWDMFHSQHEFAEMHAAGRAISGGPVYVSDYPGKHNENLLRRLVMPNGRILRTSIPARPTIDCLFKNVMQDGVSALKLWSKNIGGGGVVAAFNVQGSHWSRKDRKYLFIRLHQILLFHFEAIILHYFPVTMSQICY